MPVSYDNTHLFRYQCLFLYRGWGEVGGNTIYASEFIGQKPSPHIIPLDADTCNNRFFFFAAHH